MYTALKSAFSLIYAHFDIEGVSRWSTVESLLLLGPRVADAGLWLLRVWRLGCFGRNGGSGSRCTVTVYGSTSTRTLQPEASVWSRASHETLARPLI